MGHFEHVWIYMKDITRSRIARSKDMCIIVIANLISVEIIPIDIRISNFKKTCSPHSGQLSTLFIHLTNNFFNIHCVPESLLYTMD